MSPIISKLRYVTHYNQPKDKIKLKVLFFKVLNNQFLHLIKIKIGNTLQEKTIAFVETPSEMIFKGAYSWLFSHFWGLHCFIKAFLICNQNLGVSCRIISEILKIPIFYYVNKAQVMLLLRWFWMQTRKLQVKT